MRPRHQSAKGYEAQLTLSAASVSARGSVDSFVTLDARRCALVDSVMSMITALFGGNTRSGSLAPSFRVLGVRIQAVQIPDVVHILENWIKERSSSRYIAFTGMHGMV